MREVQQQQLAAGALGISRSSPMPRDPIMVAAADSAIIRSFAGTMPRTTGTVHDLDIASILVGRRHTADEIAMLLKVRATDTSSAFDYLIGLSAEQSGSAQPGFIDQHWSQRSAASNYDGFAQEGTASSRGRPVARRGPRSGRSSSPSAPPATHVDGDRSCGCHVGRHGCRWC